MGSTANIPTWNPNQILEAAGFEKALSNIASELTTPVGSEFINDVSNCTGVGESLWSNKYLNWEKSTVKKPQRPDGYLHYVWGWLSSNRYTDCIDRWAGSSRFFSNIGQVSAHLRQLNAFKHGQQTNLKLCTGRLICGSQYIHRGHAPFPELLFRTGKRNTPQSLPQVLLWVLHMNYLQHLKSEKRAIFDSNSLKLLDYIRNTIDPLRENSEKWVQLAEIIDSMPELSSPEDVQSFLLSACHDRLDDPSKKNLGLKDLQSCITGLNNHLKPELFFGNEGFEQKLRKEDLVIRFSIETESQFGLKPYPEKSRSGGHGRQTIGEIDNHSQQRSQGPQEPDNQEDSADEAGFFDHIQQSLTKIGSVYLEFPQRSYFRAHPYLPVHHHTALEDLMYRTDLSTLVDEGAYEKIQVDLLSALVWSAIQIGGTLESAATLRISYQPHAGWGLKPDLSGLWRTRAQQQKSTPNIDFELFFPLSHIEERMFPSHLLPAITSQWQKSNYYFGELCSLSSKDVTNSMNRVKDYFRFVRNDWTSNLLRAWLTKTQDNETFAKLIQSNADSKLSSDAAYYSCRSETAEGTLNIAGSPYLFKTEVLRQCLEHYMALEPIEPTITATWNLWTNKILTVLSCATGIRPVTDPFAERENFSHDFKLVVIDDKDVVSREARRLVKLPDWIADFIRTKYLTSLIFLRDILPSDHPLTTHLDNLVRSQSKQSIPFFFHLSEQGIESIRPSTIASDVHPGLIRNYSRHLISNHLQLQDRELIDQLLGHQVESQYTFGFASLRTLQKDLKETSKALEKLLSSLGLKIEQLAEIPDFSSLKIDVGHQTPKVFGKGLRSQIIKAAYREILSKTKSVVESRLSSFKGNSQDAQKILQEVLHNHLHESTTDTERSVVTRHAIKLFQKLLPPNVTVYHPLRKNKKLLDPFNPQFLKDLELRGSSHPVLMKLIHNFQGISKADSFVLFCLSLIKKNGITDPVCLERLSQSRFKLGKLGEAAYIEIFLGQIPKDVETCRRHQLSEASIVHFVRLSKHKNTPLWGKKIQISNQLRQELSKALGATEANKQPLEILSLIQRIEYAYQRMELPSALAEIARGNTAHRSIDSRSFFKRQLGCNLRLSSQPSETTNMERINPSINEGQILQDLRLIFKSIANPSFDLDETLPLSACRSLARKGLRSYIESLQNKRGQKRPNLATSTKKLYLGRLAEFFRTADAEQAINGLEVEEFQETISGYLGERVSSIESVNDDARQIKEYCKALEQIGFPSGIEVPFADEDFNPATTIFTKEELSAMQNVATSKFTPEATSNFSMLRNMGMRRSEALNQSTERIFIVDGEAVFQVRGNRAFKPKTPGSNRIIFSISPSSADQIEAIRSCIHNRQAESEKLLLPKGMQEDVSKKVSELINHIARRGSPHTFRHTVGDDLVRQLSNASIWGPQQKGQNSKCRALQITTPQGIRRHTLHAAGRLFGHTSPVMLLTTYSHCCFEVLDKKYRQSSPHRKPSNLTLLHSLYPETTEEIERLSDSEEVTDDKEKIPEALSDLKDVGGTETNISEPPANQLIKARFAMYENKISLGQDLRFVQFARFLEGLPTHLRPNFGQPDGKDYLRIPINFHRELISSPLFKNTVLKVFEKSGSNALNKISHLYSQEPASIRRLKDGLLEGFFRFSDEYQPLGNFTKDKAFVVRENRLEIDLAWLIFILDLGEINFEYLRVKTNAIKGEPTTQFFVDLGCELAELTKNDSKKTINYNLDYTTYWIFSVKSSATDENALMLESSQPKQHEVKKNNQSKAKVKVKVGSKDLKKASTSLSYRKAFDASKLYLHGLTASTLLLELKNGH